MDMFAPKEMSKPNKIHLEEDKMDGGQMKKNSQSIMN
jgi:hypothetical protein